MMFPTLDELSQRSPELRALLARFADQLPAADRAAARLTAAATTASPERLRRLDPLLAGSTDLVTAEVACDLMPHVIDHEALIDLSPLVDLSDTCAAIARLLADLGLEFARSAAWD